MRGAECLAQIHSAEGGILETDILKNSIRRHSNSSSLPTYLIATQFASPDPTWKVVSGCIIGSNLCALFDTGRGMARVLYQSLSEHSSGYGNHKCVC